MSLIYKGQTISGGSGAGGGGVPKGTIVIWSGSATAIPSGWALCDGQNGTPDLRDRFVVGASGEYTVGDTGGEATHALTIDEMPVHDHAYAYTTWGGAALANTTGGSADIKINLSRSNQNVTVAGSSQPHNNLPPYYALCYIMKITDSGSGSNSGGSSEDVYSTEETRIGTWIDGKPLYRRTFSFTSGSSTNATVISNASFVDTMINLYGAFRGNPSTAQLCINKPIDVNATISVWINGEGDFVYKVSNSAYYEKPAWFTVEYTKTTDEAAS